MVILPSCCRPFSWGALTTCPHHPSENSSCLWVAPHPISPTGTPPTPQSPLFPSGSHPPLCHTSSLAPPPLRPAPRGTPCGPAPPRRPLFRWPRPFLGGPSLAAGSRGPAPPPWELASRRLGPRSLRVGPALPLAAGSGPQPRVRVPSLPVRIRLRYSLGWLFEESGAGRSAAWPEVSPDQPPAESCPRAAPGPQLVLLAGLASAPRRPCIPPVLVKGVRCVYRGRFKAKALPGLRGAPPGPSRKCFHWQTIQAAPNSAQYKVASLFADNPPSAKVRPPVGGLPGPTSNRCFLGFGKKWACPPILCCKFPGPLEACLPACRAPCRGSTGRPCPLPTAPGASGNTAPLPQR